MSRKNNKEDYPRDRDKEELREGRIERLLPPETVEIYGITTWEPRSLFDKLCIRAYSVMTDAKTLVVALGALLSTFLILISFLLSLAINPVAAGALGASLIPALFVSWYIWESDPYTKEPVLLITVTFLLSTLLTGVPIVINTVFEGVFLAIPVVGTAVFFYLIVAPVEEFVKWLSIKLYAHRSDKFRTAVDGAVYGAFAGLGFAMVENILYQVILTGPAGTIQTAIGRAGVAPGHVIWSSISGYYMGLSKISKEYRGAIAFKGLTIAILLHATYNTGVTYIPQITNSIGLSRIFGDIVFGAFLIGIYAFSAYYIVSKIRRHRELCGERVEKIDIESIIG
jgi:RsiW-degrading membrane proteinase PrsW (M82 family)